MAWDIKTFYNNKELFSGLVPALIVTIVTLLIVPLTFYLTFKQTRKLKQIEDFEKLRNTLNAVDSEVAVLWKIYSEEVGDKIKSDLQGNDKILFFPYIATQNYFSIYDQNAITIGTMNNQALSKNIIWFYTKAKSLLDFFETNNRLLAKIEADVVNKTRLAGGYYCILKESDLRTANNNIAFQNTVGGLKEMAKSIKAMTDQLEKLKNEVSSGIKIETARLDNEIAKLK